MKLTSKEKIQNLLRKHGLKPSKHMGQNFLVEEEVFNKIIRVSSISKKDIVLEIGPGIGNLTQKLIRKSKKVIAVEKDNKMIKVLKEVIRGNKNVEIVENDILDFKPQSYNLKPNSYKVIGNIPYYITSPVIRKFLKPKNQPKLMTLMVQKEVAERICAKPPKMNFLAVITQFYGKPAIVTHVSKKSFWPSPKVDSAVIKITPLSSSIKFSHQFRQRFLKLVKAGFSHPRKQLVNNLLALKGFDKLKLDKDKIKKLLAKSNIVHTQRAASLTIKDWIKLAENLQ